MLNYIFLELGIKAGLPIQQIILIGGVVLVFYFFMIRPQQKRQREQRDFLSQMKRGTTVITIGGIHGTIQDIKDDVIVLAIDNKGSQLSVSRAAISIEASKRYVKSE